MTLFIGGGVAPADPTLAVSVEMFSPSGSLRYERLSGPPVVMGSGLLVTLADVYTTLAAAQEVYPFATTLAQTVDFCAVQAALNRAGVLSEMSGQVDAFRGTTIDVPQGQFRMGDAETSRLVYPGPPSGSGTGGGVHLDGRAGWRGVAQAGASSLFVWDGDVSAPPHTLYAIDATPCFRASMSGIDLLGPTRFGFDSGVIPCALGGIRLAEASYLHAVSLETFSSAIGYGGGDVSYDHSNLSGVQTNNVGHAINFLPGGGGSGDQHWLDLQLGANTAVIAIAQSCGGFVGSTIIGGGFYGAIGWLRYEDGSNAGGGNIIGNQMIGVSYETSYDATMYDELLHDGNHGGQVITNTFDYGPVAPQNTQGWGRTCAVAASSGTSLTITDNSGFSWKKGMTVVGVGVPAGTVIVSIAGAWPWNNPVLTLNNPVTSPTSVVINQPKLGAIAFCATARNHVPIGAGPADYPVYYFGNNGGNNNLCLDPGYARAHATVTPLCGGSIGSGNAWGTGVGLTILSGRMASGKSCAAGDVLMGDTSVPQPDLLSRCDGSGPPRGVAILAASGLGAVDMYQRGDSLDGIVVKNRSGSDIAALALLKVDIANPGGVTTASSMTDGVVVGRASTTGILAGATGPVSDLWIS